MSIFWVVHVCEAPHREFYSRQLTGHLLTNLRKFCWKVHKRKSCWVNDYKRRYRQLLSNVEMWSIYRTLDKALGICWNVSSPCKVTEGVGPPECLKYHWLTDKSTFLISSTNNTADKAIYYYLCHMSPDNQTGNGLPCLLHRPTFLVYTVAYNR